MIGAVALLTTTATAEVGLTWAMVVSIVTAVAGQLGQDLMIMVVVVVV